MKKQLKNRKASVLKLKQVNERQKESFLKNSFEKHLLEWPGIFKNYSKNNIYVKGHLLHKTRDMFFVDTGLKTDAILPNNYKMVNLQQKMRNPRNTLFLHVDYYDFYNGEMLVKNRPRVIKKKLIPYFTYWERMDEFHAKRVLLPGTFVTPVKGGYTVDLHDHKAFLPNSRFLRVFHDSMRENTFKLEMKTKTEVRHYVISDFFKTHFFFILNKTPERDNIVVALFDFNRVRRYLENKKIEKQQELFIRKNRKKKILKLNKNIYKKKHVKNKKFNKKKGSFLFMKDLKKLRF